MAGPSWVQSKLLSYNELSNPNFGEIRWIIGIACLLPS
jgi:hypothetical protein